MNLAVFQSIGIPELLIVLAIILVIFGPKRLPQLGRQLGSGMREFKDGLTKRSKDDEDDDEPGADTRRDASAALGRPGEETTEPVEGDVVSDKR